jgi:PAS domain S-box-containing protein
VAIPRSGVVRPVVNGDLARPDEKPARCRDTLVRVTGGVVLVVGVGVLAGWVFGVPVLKAPLPGQAAMKANAAVGFMALGAGLLLTRSGGSGRARLLGGGLATVAILIGTLTCAEYGLGRNLGLDQMLFHDPDPLGTAYPGRPAPQTAVLFVLLGVALCLLNRRRAGQSHLPRVLTGTSFVIAAFAVIGYGYGISGLYRVSTLRPIALYSALTFIVLCAGIAAADPDGVFVRLFRSEGSGVVAAKRLLPITVVVFPILGWLQLQGGRDGLYSTATGVALLVLCSTVVLVLAVLSLSKRLSRVEVERRIGVARGARLAALVDATNDAILSYDADGVITSWNRAAQALYGHTEPEVIGRRIDLLSPPALLREQRQILMAVAEGRPHIDVEMHGLHKNGSLLHTSVTISRIMHGRELIGFCSVSFDITDRTRARAELEERVRERTQDLIDSRAETLQRLALAAEYRDDDTAQHTSRVGKSAARLAEDLGLAPSLVGLIGQAAPLHDVGKIAIPDQLLLKPGALTAEEFDEMKRHTVLGAELLAGSASTVLQLGEQIALTHHERWDGSGYPKGLAGEAILIAGRIVAVVDAFDAMTNDRPYRAAFKTGDALAEIERCSGHHFDPDVAAAFLRQHRRPNADRRFQGASAADATDVIAAPAAPIAL